MAARTKIQVDERTVELTDSALKCRTLGHAWDDDFDSPVSASRVRELRAQGIYETYEACMRRACPITRTTGISREDYRTVLYRRMSGYPEGYLIAPGSGRLLRSEARAAYLSRRGV
jgi:hypothetical protein